MNWTDIHEMLDPLIESVSRILNEDAFYHKIDVDYDHKNLKYKFHNPEAFSITVDRIELVYRLNEKFYEINAKFIYTVTDIIIIFDTEYVFAYQERIREFITNTFNSEKAIEKFNL